jgi:uncharacterized damage-inducible protein DinB
MQPFFKVYYDRLAVLHQDVKNAIAGLPQEALDWVPGADMNSINVLVAHLTGAERFLIGEMVGQDPAGRLRDAEFQAKGLGAEDLFERLDDVLEHSQGVLAKLRVEDLENYCAAARHGRQVTIGWALTHILEHSANHLGHIQITRQWWQQGRS